MKNIYFTFTAGLGPVMRTGEILRNLINENEHTIFFSCPNGKEILLKYCSNYIEIDWCYSSAKQVEKHGEWMDEDHHAAMFGYLDKKMLETNVFLFLEVLKKYKIDICVSDLCVEANIACKILKIPLISVTQGCYHPNSKGNRVRWWEPVKPDSPKVYPIINEILHDFEIPPINSIVDLFVGDITIIPNYKIYDSIIAENINFSGPIMLDDKTGINNKISNEIQAFSDSFKKTFTIYPGRLVDSSGPSGRKIIEAVINCTNKYKDAGFLFFSGGTWEENDLKISTKLPNTKFITCYTPPYIPNSYGDILINHGGHGSCMMALKYGKPSLIIPSHSEREYNARAMEKMHVARMIPIDELTQIVLEENIQSLLSDDSYKDNCNYWQEEILEDKENTSRIIKTIKDMI
jgi:hypothetical protein